MRFSIYRTEANCLDSLIFTFIKRSQFKQLTISQSYISFIMPRSPSRSASISPPRVRAANRSPRQPSPPRSPPPPPTNSDKEPRLFVSGLSLEATEEELRKLFQSHGEIVDFFLKKNERGAIAFITFATLEEAEKAKECNGTELNGQNMRVDFAKPRPSNNDRGNNRQRPPRNNENNQGERKNVCFKCQKEGHFSRQCPEAGNANQEQRPNRTKTCFKCQKEGHFSKECPGSNNDNQNEQRPNRPRTCFKCHKQGHMSRECTQDTANNETADRGERANRPRTCFKCHKQGHFGKDCTQEAPERPQFNNEERKKTCFKCQKEGHFARQCTENVGNNDEGLQRRRQNQDERMFQRRDKTFNRELSFKRNVEPEEIFPSGRQDYVYQESTNEEATNVRANIFKDRNNNRGVSIEESQPNPIRRKRSVSRSESPKIARKANNLVPAVTAQPNIRKRSPSHSPSPLRNRGKEVQQKEKELVKSGVMDSRQAKVSRSRSRSKEKQKAVAMAVRKRSVSAESNSY